MQRALLESVSSSSFLLRFPIPPSIHSKNPKNETQGGLATPDGSPYHSEGGKRGPDGSYSALHPLVGRDALFSCEDLVVERREHPTFDVRCGQCSNRSELVAYDDIVNCLSDARGMHAYE